ncbi:hypothetical protein F751_1694 [Auxenochlorella protothecoides]|uniref:Glycosyltransferase n=3 Tax=Auxenochlorella protothecoides TaxID=3075 RepID=A0A087SGG1_AUXPR|nr:hypothetical protein F751_1694 [Auxenochlorella protothecoides]KFM24815.1 hypothetical protein F751_1694 [Auxenochlorella protothecoides]
MVEPLADSGNIAVTFVNYNHLDFAKNWAYHMEKTGCTAYIMGAMDEETLKELVKLNIPTFYMASNLTTNDFGRFTKDFLDMGRKKAAMVESFLALGFDTLVSDVDAVWLRNPFPFFKKFKDADMLVSSEIYQTTSVAEGLEGLSGARHGVNIGVMFLRPRALSFVQEWIANMESDPKVWDQAELNHLFYSNMTSARDRSDGLLSIFNGKLVGGVLPNSLFCNGNSYMEETSWDGGLRPYSIHASGIHSATSGKRSRLREWGFWHDEPERFTHPVGFLSYDNHVPLELLKEVRDFNNRSWTVPGVLPHFKLVNAQLSQLRVALVAAKELGGAAAVLPHLWFGKEFNAWPGFGYLHEPRLKKPFAAPADYTMDLVRMDHEIPNEYREFSFLGKPEATSLLAARVVVTICQPEADEDCEEGEAPALPKDDAVRLKPNRSLYQLRTALSHLYKSYKVPPEAGWPHVSSPREPHACSSMRVRAPPGKEAGPSCAHPQEPLLHRCLQVVHFLGRMDRAVLLSASEVTSYNERMRSWAGAFCCVEGKPGHILYDLFWDVPGHINRFNKVQEGPWEPMPGP